MKHLVKLSRMWIPCCEKQETATRTLSDNGFYKFAEDSPKISGRKPINGYILKWQILIFVESKAS